jgi:hypothetical protein
MRVKPLAVEAKSRILLSGLWASAGGVPRERDQRKMEARRVGTGFGAGERRRPDMVLSSRATL